MAVQANDVKGSWFCELLSTSSKIYSENLGDVNERCGIIDDPIVPTKRRDKPNKILIMGLKQPEILMDPNHQFKKKYSD